MQSEIIDHIRAWHRQRCFAMETRKRADLSLGSSLRSWLGWRKDLPDDDRKRIADQASALIACGEKVSKGKPHDLADTAEFKKYEAIILVAIKARSHTDEFENVATKEMERLAKLLPVWAEFGEAVRGFGPGSLTVIIGEAGDLSNYATHSKLWKRMGLAVMDGKKQGHVAKGLSKDDRKAAFIEHGFSPLRRSRMWNIGDTLVKGNRDGRYRTAYLARKAYERARAEMNGLTVAPAASIPKKRMEEFISEGHIHLRAQRYMEKRLLRDLWKAWRRAVVLVPTMALTGMPAAVNSDAPQGAGQAKRSASARTKSNLPDHRSNAPQGAGEASVRVPKKADLQLPPLKSKKASKDAAKAIPTLSSRTIGRVPSHKSRVAA